VRSGYIIPTETLSGAVGAFKFIDKVPVVILLALLMLNTEAYSVSSLQDVKLQSVYPPKQSDIVQKALVVASLNVLFKATVTKVAEATESFCVREAGIISGTRVMLELQTVTIIGNNVVLTDGFIVVAWIYISL